MEWITVIRKTINYVEENLEEDISAQDVADQVHISPFLLQRVFAAMTGYSIGEYIRNRRLYQAALDLRETDDKVIDIALRYGYETPESFTKAFTRFHGQTPSKVRDGAPMMVFHPLKVSVSIKGGKQMEHKINHMPPFRIIGFCREFFLDGDNPEDNDDLEKEIPLFWDEIIEKYLKKAYAGEKPTNAIEKAVIYNRIGEYGFWVDDALLTSRRPLLSYIIGGMYMGGEVPEGMVVYDVPENDWAVFPCFGVLAHAEQETKTDDEKFYEEFESRIIPFYSFERFNIIDIEKIREPDFQCEAWLPIDPEEDDGQD